MNNERQNGILGFLGTRAGIVWLGFGAIATFYLWTEHRAHLLGVLPFLIFLPCLLMHLFMHGGHGDHGDHGSAEGGHKTPNRLENGGTDQGERRP